MRVSVEVTISEQCDESKVVARLWTDWCYEVDYAEVWVYGTDAHATAIAEDICRDDLNESMHRWLRKQDGSLYRLYVYTDAGEIVAVVGSKQQADDIVQVWNANADDGSKATWDTRPMAIEFLNRRIVAEADMNCVRVLYNDLIAAVR